MAPEVGKKAPALTLPDAAGKKVSLKDHLGRWVVLYFYPRDDTPGCTREACAFRDLHPKFKKLDAVVLGVSSDDADSHTQFVKKYKLPFTLLSDAGNKIAVKYGVYREKNMYGKKVMGIVRSTFVIDPQGKIAKIFPRVRVDGHAEKVLEVIRG